MINGLISIGIFLTVQLVAAVWWASGMSTKMNYVIVEMRAVRNLEHMIAEKYSSKAEVISALNSHEKEIATALAFASKEMAAVWKRLDALSEAVDCNILKKQQPGGA